jgi:hypothetical protein
MATGQKHELHKYVTDEGITIVSNLEEANVNSSIRCKFDPSSNKIDQSESQPEAMICINV